MNASSTRAQHFLPWLQWAAVLTLAGVFASAAWPKLLNPAGFAEDLRNYQLFPEWSIVYMASVVPVLEAVLVVALFVPRYRRPAALIVGAMLVLFSIAIGQALYRGIDLNCGCFGSETVAPASWKSLLRNTGLLLATLLLVCPKTRTA